MASLKLGKLGIRTMRRLILSTLVLLSLVVPLNAEEETAEATVMFAVEGSVDNIAELVNGLAAALETTIMVQMVSKENGKTYIIECYGPDQCTAYEGRMVIVPPDVKL